MSALMTTTTDSNPAGRTSPKEGPMVSTRIHRLAVEILRQTPGIITMAEAIERARALDRKGVAATAPSAVASAEWLEAFYPGRR